MKHNHEDTWADTDWTQPDKEIAAERGVTRQRVHQVRRKKGVPSHTEITQYQQTTLLQDLARSRGESGPLTLNDIMEALAISSEIKALKAAKKAGIETATQKPRPPHTAGVNWDLPNLDLNIIWDRSRNWAANTRCRHNLGPAKWDNRFGTTIKDPAYLQALETEKTKTHTRLGRRTRASASARSAGPKTPPAAGRGSDAVLRGRHALGSRLRRVRSSHDSERV